MFKRLLERRQPSQHVLVDDEGVRRVRETGEVIESVTWDELVEVRVMTTDDGPFAEDVFFVLEGAGRGCVVPQGLAPDELLTRLQALPGFDDEKLIESMSSAENAEFVCWRSTPERP